MPLIRELGEALLGPRWISPLARMLNVNTRTVERWAADNPPAPAWVLEYLVEWLAAARKGEPELLAKARETLAPPPCEECGARPSDPPSRLCPGCEAYREHQR